MRTGPSKTHPATRRVIQRLGAGSVSILEHTSRVDICFRQSNACFGLKEYSPLLVYPCTSFRPCFCDPPHSGEGSLLKFGHLYIETFEVYFHVGSVGGLSLLGRPVTVLDMGSR
jgi:hypothetical protein